MCRADGPIETFEELPGVAGYTIDAPGAMILEDGVLCETLEHNWIIHVFVTNVAAFLPIGSDVDREAYRKGISSFHPDGNWIPMIPSSVTREFSLDFHEPVEVIEIAIPVRGDMVSFTPKIQKAIFTSFAQLNFANADGTIEERLGSERMQNQLKSLKKFADTHKKKRTTSGSLGLTFTRNGANSEVGNFRKDPMSRFQSFGMIEEVMLLANRAVARFCVECNLTLLYRNHTALDGSLTVEDRGRSLSVLELEALKKTSATYGLEPTGHFALNMREFMRISSPLRRFADLVNLRIVNAAISNEPLPYSRYQLEEICIHLNRVEKAYKEQVHEWYENEERGCRTPEPETTVPLPRLPRHLVAPGRVLDFCEKHQWSDKECSRQVRDQLKYGQVKQHEIISMVFKTKAETPGMKEILEEILQWIMGNTNKAVQLLKVARAQGVLTDAGIEVKAETSDQTASAEAFASVGNRTYKAKVLDGSKASAKASAVADVLRQIIIEKVNRIVAKERIRTDTTEG